MNIKAIASSVKIFVRERKKPCSFAALTLACILAVISFCGASGLDLFRLADTFYVTESSDEVFGTTPCDVKYVQSFTADKDALTGIELQFSTGGRVNDCTLLFSLYDDTADRLIQSWTLSGGSLDDKLPMHFALDETLYGVSGHSFHVAFMISDEYGENAVSVLGAAKAPQGVTLSVGGEPAEGAFYLGLTYIRTTALFFLLIAIVFIAIEAVFFFLIFDIKLLGRFKLPAVGTLFIFLLGIGYMLAFTPFSNPDGIMHYQTAAVVSNRMMGRADDKTLEAKYYDMDGFSQHYSTSAGYLKLLDGYEGKTYGEDVTLSEARSDNYNYFPAYMFSAAGMTLGRVLGLNMLQTYYLGCFFNLLLHCVCAFFAMLLIPRFKVAVFLVAACPMVMELAVSFSKDAFVNALGILCGATLISLVVKEGRLKWTELLVPLISLALIIPTRATYVLMAVLLFAIPKRRMKNVAVLRIILGVLVAAAAVVFIVARGDNVLHVLGFYGDAGRNTAYYDFTESVTGSFKQTMLMLTTSSRVYLEFYAASAVGSQLAGLSFMMYEAFIYGYMALMAMAFLLKDGERVAFSLSYKLMTAGVLLATLLATLIGMMGSWTTVGSKLVEGVQGRYFIPLLLPAASLFSFKNLRVGDGLYRFAISSAMFLQLGLFIQIIAISLTY